MKLSHCLNSCDITTLRRIADTYDFTCSRSSKNDLMQEIMMHFNNKNFIGERIEKVADEAYRESIAQLVLDKRREFSKEEITAVVRRAGQYDEKKAMHAVEQLQSDGWIYGLGQHSSKQRFLIPDDLRERVKPYIQSYFQQKVQLTSTTPIVHRDENLALVRDTSTFLSYTSRKELKLTQDGVLFKRSVQAILQLFEIKEEALTHGGWRFGYGRRFHDYPDRFALLYDFCFAHELISEGEDGFLHTSPKVQKWLEKPETDRLLEMYRYWLRTYRHSISNISTAVGTLIQAVHSRWVEKDSLNQLLTQYVSAYYYDTQTDVIEKRIYQMMIHLGLLMSGQLEDGGYVLRLTKLGHELLLDEKTVAPPSIKRETGSSLFIQPNFDLWLPLDQVNQLSWDIDQFAHLIEVDHMRKYRLTKESIHQGVQAGWTAKGICDFLLIHSNNRLPANVETMVHHWVRESHKITLSTRIVISCIDSTVADEVEEVLGIQKLETERISEQHFAVDPRDWDSLFATLQSSGYMPTILQ